MERTGATLLNLIRPDRLRRYSGAALAVFVAAGLHWLTSHVVGPISPFIFMYPTVLLVAILAGRGPGTFASIVATLIAAYWLMEPRGTLVIRSPGDGLSLAIFVGMSIFLCQVAERLRQVTAREADAKVTAQIAESRLQQTLDTVKAEKEWLALVLASINEEVYFTDTEGRYTYANPTAMQEFGHDTVAGKTVSAVVEKLTVLRPDGTPRPIDEAPPLRALQGQIIRDEEQLVLTPRTGELRVRLVSAIPIRDPSGRIAGAVSTVRDITALKRIEASLREADDRKNVFLATLAHELRNPLAPIRAAAHLLTSASRPEDLERCRQIIVRQASHMASLLEDLLDISRFTRGELSLKKAYAAMQQILDGAVETAQPAIAAKRQRLTVKGPPGAVTVEVDPLRLTQVVSNLLANAAKYTPSEGEILLECRLCAESLIIIVRDNGIGIEPKAFSRVFDMFVQLEATPDHSEGGLGIGLALVRALVELHGGQVSVASEGRNKGSTFTVALPRSVVVTKDWDLPADSDTKTGQSRCVLVADDNADAASTLQMVLSNSGHEVHVARNGIEAMDLAARIKPHIAVLDIGMPGLNGYEVATRIRREAWGTDMVLVALTGWGQESDKRQAVAAGFDHHLTKPADPEELDALVAGSRNSQSR